MKKIKYVCLLILVCSMMFLTGCWNYREVDALAIVSGIAIDKGEQGLKYHVTFELLDLSQGSKSSAQPKLAESDGDTIFDAVRNINSRSEQKLFFSDCKTVILSNELAKDGIQPVLDWFARDTEPRITLNLVISQDETAAKILEKESSPGDISSYKIANMIDHDLSYLGKDPKVTLYQAYNMLGGKGVSLILPSIKTVALKSGNTLDLSGTAMFKKDKLIGFIDNDDSKFLLFIKDKIQGGILLANIDSSQNNISLEIDESKTKVTPVVSNGQIAMKISIKTKVAIGENNTGKDELEKDAIDSIKKSAEKQVVTGVTNVIQKVQKVYDSDIFGFGTIIYQNDPELWKKIEPQWDEQFKTLKYEVSAEIAVENTGTTKIKEKGGD